MNKVIAKVFDTLQIVNAINHGVFHAWAIIIGTAGFILATKLCAIFGTNWFFVGGATVAILIAFIGAYKIRNFKGFPLR